MTRSRKSADKFAKEVLDRGGVIADEDVLAALRLWRFKKNTARANVMQENQHYVLSETMGIVCSRDGRLLLSKATKEHPAFMSLLCLWVQQHRPPMLQRPFAFTSISLNANYNARIHRDGNNAGPSLTRALGSFTGGALEYWPDDDGEVLLDALPPNAADVLETGKGFAIFDGRRAHVTSSVQCLALAPLFCDARREPSRMHV